MDQIGPLPALPQDEVRVGAWAEVRELLELQLAPLGRRALAALAPHPGESVLDIGCGGGETALDLVRAVAPDGTVVGIDLSAAVLAFAQRAVQGCERVRFVQADAEVFPFELASFDAAFSRFGVMFFADPAAAFINIRRSLRPNGRLAFVCWRALEENPLDILPLRAASAHLPPQPAHDPDAPGPFAFANPHRVRGILERAGFGEIDITAHDEQVGSGDLDAMLAVCSRVGALGKILRENPELRAATLPAVRSALAAHDGPDGVRLNAATWVVTARAPAGLQREKSAKGQNFASLAPHRHGESTLSFCRASAIPRTGHRCQKQQKLTLAAVTLSDHTAPLRMSRAEGRTFRARHGG